MQYHKVELCGVNTAKLPVLKEKEKAALLRAVRTVSYTHLRAHETGRNLVCRLLLEKKKKKRKKLKKRPFKMKHVSEKTKTTK